MPSSTKDPDLLREQIKGSFSFRQSEDSPWIDVLFKVGDEGPFADEEDDEEEEDYAENLEDPGSDQNPKPRADDTDEVGFTLDLGRVLLRIDPVGDRLLFEPLTRTGRNDFSHRYRQVKTIVLEGFGFDRPENPDDVIQMLASWPKGFTQNPDFGLGLRNEYRHIVHAIEEVPGVELLIVSKKRSTKIDEESFLLSYRDFETIRRAIDTCHRNALGQASADKADLAHNGLLTRLDPAEYPERIRVASEGTVFKVLEFGAKERVSDKSQLAAVRLVTRNSKNLASNHPETLMRLRRDIELVTLEEVIQKMDSLINGKTSEARWQKLFHDHPFILSLAFSLPIILFKEQASVGGSSFEGKGEKITDFLYKNGLTDNLTIIEIKAASTTLLGARYRGGVYPLSRDLVE